MVTAAAQAPCPHRLCLMHSIDPAEAPSQTHPPGGPARPLSWQSWGAALLTWPSAQTQPEMWNMGRIRRPPPVLCWALFLRRFRAQCPSLRPRRVLLRKKPGPIVLPMGSSSGQISCVTLGGPLVLTGTHCLYNRSGVLVNTGMTSGWPAHNTFSALSSYIYGLS